jgi:hypothetical protein
MHKSISATLAFWLGSELLFTAPPLIYAARRRKLSMLHVLMNVPFVYLTKAINVYYAWKAFVVELILVPLRLSPGLVIYEKGRACTPPNT